MIFLFSVEEDSEVPDSKENKGKVMHCTIKRDLKGFKMGSLQFESLNELIAHYVKNPIYKQVKLSYPVTEEVIRDCQCKSTVNLKTNLRFNEFSNSLILIFTVRVPRIWIIIALQ